MKLVYDVDAFDIQMQNAENEILQRIVKGVSMACAVVEAEAVDRCPEGDHEGADTVSLAASIATKVEVNGAKVSGVVGTGVDYAIYVHEGTGIKSRTGMGRTHDLPWSYMDDLGNWHTTSGMEAKPFLEEAFDAKRTEAEEVMKKVVRGG